MKKKRSIINTKKNIAMTACLVILYPVRHHYILFVFYDVLYFFLRLQLGFSISSAYLVDRKLFCELLAVALVVKYDYEIIIDDYIRESLGERGGGARKEKETESV